MHPGSRLVLVGLFVLVVPMTLLLFLALGPVGWLALVTIAVVAGAVSLWRGPPDDDAPVLVNCPACGAPNDPGAETCRHCERAL